MEENININVNPTESGKFALLLRIPGWAKNKPVPSDLYHYVDDNTSEVKISVNGQNIKRRIRGGYAVIDREWKSGDIVKINMELPVRRVQAHLEVKYDEGLLSIERGPILYVLESTDLKKDFVFYIVIPRNSQIKSYFDKDLLNGITVLEGNGYTIEKDSTNGQLTEKPFRFKAIPYSTWNNRGHSQLVTWIPETSQYAIIKPEPTIASRAQQINGWGFNDQFEPNSSADTNTPYHYWWLKSGTEESIGYKFNEPVTVSTVEVYWLAFEHYDVIYKAPESWKLLYKDGNTWKEMENPSGYGTELDKYNKVTFDPVTTTQLKLVAQLQRPEAKDVTEESGPQIIDVGRKGYSGGVIEWKVY